MLLKRWFGTIGLVLGLVAIGLLATPDLARALTYYVAPGGDNGRDPFQAQNPDTPWASINRALQFALGGDTINVAPGTYAEKVESRRDGTATGPIVLRSADPTTGRPMPGAATIQPPPDPGTGLPVANGVFISHNYHTILGFKVTGATIGMRLGAHDGPGNLPVIGGVVSNNEVFNNSSNGIQVSPGLAVEISFNSVHDNGTGVNGNGIRYDGNSSLIHDNVVFHNPQKGVLITGGVDHVVYDNFSHDNGQGPEDNLVIQGTTLPTPAETYYVDCLKGDDSRSPTDAKNSATPWQTIKNALLWADGGDTVMVIGGTVQAPRNCGETEIRSKKAGTAGAVITIKAAPPGAVIIDPPSGNGFLINHSYNGIDGFVVTGATNGIQVNGDGTLAGVVLSGNRVFGNSQVGIKVAGAVSVAIIHNVIFNNQRQGITYDGSGANIFNNLVYSNGIGASQGYGIEISSGNGHKVINNTVYQNLSGGIRLGTSTGTPVYSTVVNNIVVDNHVGIKEPSASGYQGIAKLEFNTVINNSLGNFDLSPTGSVVGASAISQDPLFASVNRASPDFLKLSRVASGQAVNSPCIDRGSTAADTIGLGTRSAFTDNTLDTGRVDLGYHWPVPAP